MARVSLADLVESHFRELKETTNRIETQVIRTNGRVTSLEKWRNMILGGWFVLSAIIIPITVFVLKLIWER